MDIEVRCDCGNPECLASAQFRRGYVHIMHPDGRKEVRWDYLYIDAFGWDKDDKGGGKSTNIEIMLPPREARRLMWFLIRTYLPVVHHLCDWWAGHVLRWWRLGPKDWWLRRRGS